MREQMQRMKVLGAGILNLLLVMGVARFAYTPLLPLMQEQAGLGVADAGWLAAWNYAGYLCGALAASMISDLVLKDRLYRIGLVVAVVTTVMMGLTTSIFWWSVSRFLGGLSTASGMLLGTGLILNWLIRHQHRSELGIHFSGIGLGIAGCAAAVALMTQWLDWREQWFVFGALGLLLLIPAWRWLPRPDTTSLTVGGQKMEDNPPSAGFLRVFMAAYFCAGVGYVVSATFIVAIVDRLPGLQGQGWLVFLVLGLSAAPACIVWDFIARRVGYLNSLLLSFVLQSIGMLMPLAGGLVPALFGAILFGGNFIGAVSLVLTMAGRYYPTRPAKMMGKMTIAYGIAQIVGPAVTGSLAARGGSYADGLYMAAGVMAVGTVLLVVLRVMAARGRENDVTAGNPV